MRARIETSTNAGASAAGNRRYAPRRLLRLQVPGNVSDTDGADVVIHDLSSTGLLIETSAVLAAGARLDVELPETGATSAQVVWNDGRLFGCRFETAIPARALAAAQLMASPQREESLAGVTGHGAAVAADILPAAVRLRVIGALALGAWVLVLMPLALAARIFT